MYLYEIDIPAEEKEKFISHWDESYLIQKRWIQKLENAKKDLQFLSQISHSESNGEIDIEVEGLGYFQKKDIGPVVSSNQQNLIRFDSFQLTTDLNLLREQSDTFWLAKYRKSVTEEPTKSLDLNRNNPQNLAFKPPIFQTSIFEEWQNNAQKQFVREHLLSPHSLQSDAFISMNQNESYRLTEKEMIHLNTVSEGLKTNLEMCISDRTQCTGTEEIVILIRLYACKESLAQGFYVVPKKANEIPFYYPDSQLIPKPILEEKSREADVLFQITRQNFLAHYDELGFVDFEKNMAKIDALKKQSFDIINFESFPSKTGIRKFQKTKQIDEIAESLFPHSEKEYEFVSEIVPQIYPYHLIISNCTGEIFRYHNEFYQSEKDRERVLGGTVSEKVISLSFVPFISAKQIQKNYRINHVKKILSYRLIKKSEMNLSVFQNLKEDFRPLSTLYKKNPYDQSFLFFTDDTIFLRPIYGLTNITWALGVSTVGIISLPLDKGTRLYNGLQSVFFSFPELLFLNIRKGYFPYVTKKDLPKTYHETIELK
ncbi:MAG: hypothetical protein O9264_09595 [Leptospira sp.]|nr:hypothetical protein [Leptospira sp.]